MGRQALVTLEHVKAAVTALKAEGKAVSSRSVREKLGNVGSMGTINKLLQRCLNGKDQKPDSLRQLPPELQRLILGFADQQAEDARTQIAEELVQCRAEMNDLAAENERLTADIEDLRAQLASAATEKAAVEGQVAQLTCELAAAREEAAVERRDSQAGRIDVVKLQLRIDALTPLESELQETRKQCEAYRDACIRSDQANAVLEAQRRTLDSQVCDLKRELAEARANSLRLSEKTERLSELFEQERAARVLAERELAIASAMTTKRTSGNHRKKTEGQSATSAEK